MPMKTQRLPTHLYIHVHPPCIFHPLQDFKKAFKEVISCRCKHGNRNDSVATMERRDTNNTEALLPKQKNEAANNDGVRNISV